MQKLLAVSDSHGREDNLWRAVEREKPFSLFLHLGDVQGSDGEIAERLMNTVRCPALFVAGNCDLFSRSPDECVVNFGKHRILMVHGHRHHVNMGYELLREDARLNGCDIVMFGHIHVPVLDDSAEGILVMNPGSISLPRQQGRRPSYLVLEQDDAGRLYPEIKYL